MKLTKEAIEAATMELDRFFALWQGC